MRVVGVDAAKRGAEESRVPAIVGASGSGRPAEASCRAENEGTRAAASGCIAAVLGTRASGVHGQRVRTVGVGSGGRRSGEPTMAGAHGAVSLPRMLRAVRSALALLGAQSAAGTRLSVVDLARLEDEAAGYLDWLERRATDSPLAVRREQRKIPDFAMGTCQRVSE